MKSSDSVQISALLVREVSRDRNEDILTTNIGNMSNTLNDVYKVRVMKQDTIINDVQSVLKEKKGTN